MPMKVKVEAKITRGDPHSENNVNRRHLSPQNSLSSCNKHGIDVRCFRKIKIISMSGSECEHFRLSLSFAQDSRIRGRLWFHHRAVSIATKLPGDNVPCARTKKDHLTSNCKMAFIKTLSTSQWSDSSDLSSRFAANRLAEIRLKLSDVTSSDRCKRSSRRGDAHWDVT